MKEKRASINVKQTMQTQIGFYTNYLAILAADDVEAKTGGAFVDDDRSRISVGQSR
jgi:hypothetical protein